MKKYNPNAELVRLVIMGSVDDGKSTFIGRLFYDLGEIYQDQLEAIEKASKKGGLDFIDLSLLTDGLSAEREQKITIDAAYRYLATPKRRFIVADVPGHEQYTRNMATGASLANLAIIMVDAQKGLLPQSKRHLFISSLLGVRHVLVAINKMDLANYDQNVFEKIKDDFSAFLAKLNIPDIAFIPVSSLKGDMIVERSANMPWYQGATALNYLESVEIANDINLLDFRMPVQLVIRPDQNFRGYAGRIEGGTIRVGERVKILPSGHITRIESILIDGKKQSYAFSPQNVILALHDEVDASRGDMIVRENNLPEIGNKFETTVCWMKEEPLLEHKRFILKQTTRTCRCFVDKILYKIDTDSLHRQDCSALNQNEIGRVSFTAMSPLVFDPYTKNRNTGSFIIIDATDNSTAGAGMILRKSQNTEQKSSGKGFTLWFTGLPSSGKSTLANALAKELAEKYNLPIERLDGDQVRKTICRDLDFSVEDRQKNIERITYVAKLLTRHGVAVITSFVSPNRQVRNWARQVIGNFVEIYTKCPVEECIKRDPKGNYKKAIAGQLVQFTGVSDSYEEPDNPEIVVETDKEDIGQCTQKIITSLKKLGYL